MATCTESSPDTACQEAVNKRDAIGLALTADTIAPLPGSAQAMWGLRASADVSISYLADDTVGPINAAIAGQRNVFGMGSGSTGTMDWDVTGGALDNWISNKNPLSGIIPSGVSSATEYGIGRGIT